MRFVIKNYNTIGCHTVCHDQNSSSGMKMRMHNLKKMAASENHKSSENQRFNGGNFVGLRFSCFSLLDTQRGKILNLPDYII